MPRQTAAQKAAEAAQKAADPLADLRDAATLEGPQIGQDAPQDMPGPETEQTPEAPVLADADGQPYPDDVQAAFLEALNALAVPAAPLVTEQDQDAEVALMVAAWHDNTPALGFLHGGGNCGCRYLARTALRITTPAKSRRRED